MSIPSVGRRESETSSQGRKTLNPNPAPLFNKDGVNLQAVTSFLDKGGDIDAPLPLVGGLTLLHLAARRNKGSLSVKFLLAKNATVDPRTESGATPLYLAAQKGGLEVVRALLGANASVDARGAKEKTPLHVAARNGHVEVCTLLLSEEKTRVGQINATCTGEATPLDVAIGRGKTEVVNLLRSMDTELDTEVPPMGWRYKTVLTVSALAIPVFGILHSRYLECTAEFDAATSARDQWEIKQSQRGFMTSIFGSPEPEPWTGSIPSWDEPEFNLLAELKNFL